MGMMKRLEVKGLHTIEELSGYGWIIESWNFKFDCKKCLWFGIIILI